MLAEIVSDAWITKWEYYGLIIGAPIILAVWAVSKILLIRHENKQLQKTR